MICVKLVICQNYTKIHGQKYINLEAEKVHDNHILYHYYQKKKRNLSDLSQRLAVISPMTSVLRIKIACVKLNIPEVS
jgi:hypothetical protein